MKYKDLPIEHKFEVLERWVSYCTSFKIGMVTSKKGSYPLGIPSIEKFFESSCGDFVVGSKRYALRFATHCYYCECELTRTQDLRIERDPLPTEVTVDHFYPRTHKMRNVDNRLVISCYQCNQLKGSISPESIINRIEKHKKNIPGGWDLDTAYRIRNILMDVAFSKGHQIYYLKQNV